jgi:hypothetical protein
MQALLNSCPLDLANAEFVKQWLSNLLVEREVFVGKRDRSACDVLDGCMSTIRVRGRALQNGKNNGNGHAKKEPEESQPQNHKGTVPEDLKVPPKGEKKQIPTDAVQREGLRQLEIYKKRNFDKKNGFAGYVQPVLVDDHWFLFLGTATWEYGNRMVETRHTVDGLAKKDPGYEDSYYVIERDGKIMILHSSRQNPAFFIRAVYLEDGMTVRFFTTNRVGVDVPHSQVIFQFHAIRTGSKITDWSHQHYMGDEHDEGFQITDQRKALRIDRALAESEKYADSPDYTA